jgi:VanZ family protein
MGSSENTSLFIVPLLNFLFARLSPHDVDLIHGLIRKAGHVTEYFILGLLLFRAFRGDSPQAWCVRWTIYALIGTVLYAMSDEYHQAFVATRTACLIDVGFDSAGGVLSQIVVGLWNLRQLYRSKPSHEG